MRDLIKAGLVALVLFLSVLTPVAAGPLEDGIAAYSRKDYAWGRHPRDPYDWAVRFENVAKEMILAGEYKPLVNHATLGPDAALSIPTADYYLPLLYVLAAGQKNEIVRFPLGGVDGGSISMLAVKVG